MSEPKWCTCEGVRCKVCQDQIDKLYAALREMEERLAATEEERNNLLARIHRDGGHYVGEHGVKKACADADLIVANLHALSDEKMPSDGAERCGECGGDGTEGGAFTRACHRCNGTGRAG